MQTSTTDHGLCGLVTERDLDLAELEFPGISNLYATRRGLDRTFLDLLAAYLSIVPTSLH
jgi:hypothetical protein